MNNIVPRDVAQSFTWLQNFVQQILSENGTPVEEIIKDIADLSKNAMTSTPIWDQIEDNKTRLAAKKLLLEMSWVYKQKGMNINFDFNSVIFDGKPEVRNNRKDTAIEQATVIEQ